MRLYIIRHADPDYSKDSITPAGHLEAKALAERLSGYGLDRIYSSPLGRARRTAEYTAESVGLPVDLENWTVELGLRVDQPPWGDLHICDVPGEVVRGSQDLPTHTGWYKADPYTKPENAEEIAKLVANSDEFLARQGYERIGSRYKPIVQNREKVAVFCHAAFGLAWIAHLLEIPPPLMWSGFWPPPSSVTTILFEERSTEWAVPRCIGFGDISHLYKAGLPVQHRGLYGNLD